jgi:hypothetical protein
MLRNMCEEYPFLKDEIEIAATSEYRLTVEDLPSPEQEKECTAFSSKLCRDLYNFDLETANPEFCEDGLDDSQLHGDELGLRRCEGVFTSSSEPSLVCRYPTPAGCRC